MQNVSIRDNFYGKSKNDQFVVCKLIQEVKAVIKPLQIKKKKKKKKKKKDLTLCMLGKKKSADDILKYFFLFFLENRKRHFMQIVSKGDNVHEVSNPFF